jgi:hypothetical protein
MIKKKRESFGNALHLLFLFSAPWLLSLNLGHITGHCRE